MHRWACIIATSLAHTSDGDLSRTTTTITTITHIYLHHQQSLLQDSSYLSIRTAPSFRAPRDMEGVGGRRARCARYFWQQSHPRSCSLRSLPWLTGVEGGGPFLFLSLPFPCIPPILIIPRPSGSSFLLARAWAPCPCPPPRRSPPPSHSSISQIPGPCLCPRACPALSSSISYPRPGLTD